MMALRATRAVIWAAVVATPLLGCVAKPEKYIVLRPHEHRVTRISRPSPAHVESAGPADRHDESAAPPVPLTPAQKEDLFRRFDRHLEGMAAP